MKIYYCLLVLIICSTLRSNAQWPILKTDADSLIKVGADYIYNVQFSNAEETFKKVIDKYPENPAGYFLDAMVIWWKISTYRNTESYDQVFLNKIDKVLLVCEDLLTKNPLDISALFFKGGALGYRGRFYAIRKSWFKAASDGFNGFDILLKCYNVAPSNHDIMLGTGIYNYFAAALPEQYPAIKPLIVFAPKGDKAIGKLQLQAASRYARYANIEAKFLLMQVFYDFEKDANSALKLAEELNQKYPNNAMFHRYLGRCYVSVWDTDKFDKVWRDIILRYMDNQPGYDVQTAREALYYIGTSLMIQSKYEVALKYFYKCDEASRKIDTETSGFMIMTNLKIGKIFDIQGKRDLAIKQYKKVALWKDYQGSQNEANELIKKPFNKYAN
jgi:tetratricopeptide (TPR) repeat protein